MRYKLQTIDSQIVLKVSKTMINKKTIYWSLFGIIAVFGLYFLGNNNPISMEFIVTQNGFLKEFIAENPISSILITTAILTITIALMGFASPVCILSGFYFGFYTGLAIAIIGETIGAMIVFLYGRYLFKSFFLRKLGDRFKEITIKLGVTTASFYYEGPEKFVIYQKQLDETFNPVASVVMKQESKEVFMVVVFIPGAKRDKQLNCIPFNQNILKAGNMIFLNLASKQVAFRLGQEYAELDSQQKTTLEVQKIDHPGFIQKDLILEKGKLKVFRSIFLKKPKEENATLVIFYPYITNGGSKNKKTKHSFHVIPVKF